MKKRIVILSFVFVFLLFLLSSCFYTASEVDELVDKMDVQWSEQYYKLQEEYDLLSDKLETVYADIWLMDEDLTSLFLYFEENSISFDEAYEAYESLQNKINKYIN